MILFYNIRAFISPNAYFYHMRTALTALITFISITAAFAQGRVMPHKHTTKRDSLYTDNFNGAIYYGTNINHLQLALKHCQYCDDGTFTLVETVQGTAKTSDPVTGSWTVLKGSAKDDNATVVEIDIPGRTLYFLRLKSGNLQQLDGKLREIEPVEKHILRKQ